MSGPEWVQAPLGEVAVEDRDRVTVEPQASYRIAGVLIAGQGAFLREDIEGSATKYDKLYRLSAGQLVYRKLTAWEGPITVVPEELDGAFVSPEFPTFTLDPSRLLPEYMRLICQQPSFHDEMRTMSTGTAERRSRLNPRDLLEIEIDLPPIDKQRAIVEIVGAAEELRRASDQACNAADAVFRGLGQELFSSLDAPEHELGEVTKVTSGGTPSRQRPDFYEGDIPWVKTGEVRFSVIHDTEEHISEQALRESSAKLFPVGTVVIAMYGQGATRGRVGILGREMATNQACAAVLPSSGLRERFLFHWLWSRYAELREEGEGSSQDNLSGGLISSLLVPIPDLATQDAIVAQLDAALDMVEQNQAEAIAARRLSRAIADALLSGSQRVRV